MDVVGYSRLMAVDEVGTLGRLKDLRVGVIWEMSVKAFRRGRSDAVDVWVAGKDTVNKAPRAFGARQGGEVQ